MKNTLSDLGSLEVATLRKALKTIIALTAIEPKSLPKDIPQPTLIEKQTAEKLLSEMSQPIDFLEMLS